VLHGDLKPANVIVTVAGEPVLTDFGLALRETGPAPTPFHEGDLAGTRAYVAPEVVMGGRPTPQTDQYGLGAILFFVLTGRHLYPAAPTEALARVDPRLAVICKRALAERPTERYRCVGDMARALQGYLEPRRWLRAAVPIGLALVLIGAGVGVALTSRSFPTQESKASPDPVAPDRALAEWALSVHGTVKLHGHPDEIARPDALPWAAFTLQGVRLDNSAIGDRDLQRFRDHPVAHLHDLGLSGTAVTDAGLLHLAGLKRSLRYLFLASKGITDMGLPSLQGFDRLEMLHLGGSRVTDAGLGHLAMLPALEWLSLNDTGVTDTGINELKALPRLSTLELERTAVTPAGIQALRQANPRLQVHP
jgi:hypothetical protein